MSHYQGDSCPGRHCPDISLSGAMRSGKDTVAQFLIEKYGYVRLSFAGELKREVARGVGCTIKELDEEPLKSQIRPVLQVWGAEFRREQDPDYWVQKVANSLDKLTSLGDPFVVTDSRFLNEIAMLRERGFLITKIDMPGEQVMDYMREQGISEDAIEERLSHASETEWTKADFDAVIPSVRGRNRGPTLASK